MVKIHSSRTPGTASSPAAASRYGHQRTRQSPTAVTATGAAMNSRPCQPSIPCRDTPGAKPTANGLARNGGTWNSLRRRRGHGEEEAAGRGGQRERQPPQGRDGSASGREPGRHHAHGRNHPASSRIAQGPGVTDAPGFGRRGGRPSGRYSKCHHSLSYTRYRWCLDPYCSSQRAPSNGRTSSAMPATWLDSCGGSVQFLARVIEPVLRTASANRRAWACAVAVAVGQADQLAVLP